MGLLGHLVGKGRNVELKTKAHSFDGRGCDFGIHLRIFGADPQGFLRVRVDKFAPLFGRTQSWRLLNLP
ncbi:hypothetical protein ACM42_11660 [Bradyrhizobium sp. CCBAU 25338]|nr:hypothetical protein [Bradyrhizobium sp. CCBAU 25338]